MDRRCGLFSSDLTLSFDVLGRLKGFFGGASSSSSSTETPTESSSGSSPSATPEPAPKKPIDTYPLKLVVNPLSIKPLTFAEKGAARERSVFRRLP